MTANHVGHDIATFPGSATVGGRTITSVGFATPNWGLVCSGSDVGGPPTEALHNVGRGHWGARCCDCTS